MKRALLVLSAVALAAVSLAACGESSSSGGGGSGEKQSSSEVKLAVLTASTTQNAFQEMAHGAEAAAAHEGVQIAASAPNGINPPQEVSEFQAQASNGVDGISVMTTAPELFLRPFQEASEDGVPVVAMDAAAPEGSGVETFVGNSNVTVGETLVKAMLKELPQSGEVVIGNDTPGLPLQEERIEGMENVLKGERPELKIAGAYNVGSEPAENFDHWNSLLKAHPDAVAYLAPGDQDAVPLERIEKANGEKFLAGACDVDPIALEAVKEGYVYALGDPWHFMKGYISASLLARQAKTGEPMPEGWWNPGQGLVTAANVDEVMKRESSVKNRDAYFEPIAEKELKDPSKYLKPLSALGG